MADQAAYTRIYDLKSMGIDKIIADVNIAISKFEILAAAKNKVANTDISDPKAMADFNAQMTALITNVDKMAAATDKNAASQEKLAESLSEVMDMQKNVTVSMQQGAQAMGNNLTASVAGLTKIQAAQTGVIDGTQQMAERLAVLKNEISGTNDYIKLLNGELKEGKISMEQFEGQAGEATNVLVEQRAEAQVLTQVLKMQAMAQDAVAGSINEARTQAALMRKELNSLNLTTEDGIERQKVLIAEIAEYDAFIKSNADLYTRQKINIGNYPTVGAELSAIRVEMQKLAVAGEQDSERFIELSARAQDLSASMREVASSTGKAVFSLENLGRKAETMGFRMIAHLVVFTIAIEVITKIVEAFKDASGEAERLRQANEELAKSYSELSETTKQFHDQELANTIQLLESANNLTDSYTQRYEAVKKLIELYPDLLANMDAESIMSGKAAKKISEFNDIIELQTRLKGINADIDKTKEALAKAQGEKTVAQDEYNAERAGDLSPNLFGKSRIKALSEASSIVADLQNHLEQLGGVLDDTKISLNELLHPKHQGRILSDIDTDISVAERLRDVTTMESKEHSEALKKLKALDAERSKYLGEKPIKDKKTHQDYLNSSKDLYDADAMLLKDYIQVEADINKRIAENQNNSLDDRLRAIERYYADLNKIAEIQRNKSIKDEEAKKAELDRKKKDGKITPDNYTNEVNASGIRSAAALQQYDAATGNNQASMAAAKGKIYNDQLTLLNKHISDEQIANQTALDKELLTLSESYAKHEITDKKYAEKKKALVDKYNIEYLNSTVASLTKEIEASKLDSDAQKKLIDELAAYKKKVMDATIKANEDSAKNEHITTKQIADASLEIVSSFANAEMELLAKKDAYREEMAKRSMDWNKKVRDSETQSLAQKRANDKADFIAEQQLNKQRAIDAKKRAETMEIINFVVASGKNFADHEFYDALVNEAVLVGEFAAKEALLSSAPAYAQGTGSGTHGGGWAYVGDGGESELAKIGGKYYITPSTTTAVNMPAGSQVAPLSQFGGNLGQSLQAPRFNASSSSSADTSLHQSVTSLHQSVATIAAGMSNIKVTLDTQKTGRAIKNGYYTKVHL